MPTKLAQAEAKAILEHIVGRTEMAKPGELFIGLLSAEPTTGMTVAELEAKEAKYASYARLAIKGAEWKEATEGATTKIVNSGTLKFGNPTSGGTDPQTLTHAVLFTKAKGTGGSWVAFGSLASSIEVSYAGAKYPVEIAAEKLELTLV